MPPTAPITAGPFAQESRSTPSVCSTPWTTACPTLKTTVNTVVKACREAGYLRLDAMPGQPRERQVCLTEEGHAYAARVLEELYRAEDAAMAEAVSRFGPGFVEALECFSRHMRAALEGPPGKSEKEGSDPHENPII